MASQVDIINHALTKLGEIRIQDVEEDTKPAREALAVWDLLLESELSANSWTFAARRASIAALASAPAWGYQFAYEFPSDLLALTYVNGQSIISISDFNGSTAPIYKVEGREILTDIAGPLQVMYTALVTDPDKWDAGFRNAFAIKLAQVLCFPLTQREGKETGLYQEYQLAVQVAKQRAAIQMPPQTLQDSTWFAERAS